MSGTEDSANSGWGRPRWLAPGGVAAYAAVGLLAVVVFVPAFYAAFLWDDTIIVNLPEVVSGFADIWLNPRLIEGEAHYWPVVYTTFWVEYLLWGLDPSGYHAVNVVLHAANSMLVYALLRRFTVPGAWAAAAIFAVHPAHVDSVAWAIERKDVLSTLFYLSSAMAYVNWDERQREAVARRSGRAPRGEADRSRSGRNEALYAASLVLFALALLSKSIVVTLPVMLVVYLWWRTGRVAGRDAIRTIPFFAVAVGVTLADLAYYRSRESLSLDISLAERAQILSRSFWHYVEKLLLPNGLLPLYPRWDVDGADLLGWGLLLAGVVVVVGLWILRHHIGRGPLAGLLFFGVTLAPVLGIIDFGYMRTSYVADRFQYLAGIGLIALVVGTFAHLAGKYGIGHRLNPTRVLAGLCVPVLAILGVITWRMASNYESPEKFFTYIVTNNPTARGGAYMNLGNAYLEQGRIDETIAAYEQSLENDAPDLTLTLYNLGLVYARTGDPDTGESYYRQALDLNPNHSRSLTNLAVILIGTGELEEADELLQKALQLTPHSTTVLNNAALLKVQQDNPEEAVMLWQRVLDRRPDDKDTLFAYGSYLYDSDRWNEAEPVLRRALDADSRQEGAARMLATVLIRLGRDDEAVALVEQNHLESLSASIADGEVERGNDLLTEGRIVEAMEAYQAAVDAVPDHLAAHVQLGVAYENLGRPQDALASYRHAYELDDENISAIYFLGLLSARSEHYEEALTLFDQAEVLFVGGQVPLVVSESDLPEMADVHLNRGVVLTQLGRLDEALADIDQALELDPTLELAAYNREQILGMIAQRDEQSR